MRRIAVALLMMTVSVTALAQTSDTTPPPAATTASPATRPDRQTSGHHSRKSRRTTESTTRGSSSAAEPAPLGRDFELLTRRSMFIKGRQADGASGDSGSDSAPAEDVLVFNGVTESDHQTVAFIEDTSTKKVQLVQAGQSIAQGKITRITLDSLEYRSADGHATRISVGQNLLGKDAWNQTYGLGSSDVSSTSDQPVDGATASLIERMRQRRLQELNGGSTSSATTAPSAAR